MHIHFSSFENEFRKQPNEVDKQEILIKNDYNHLNIV